MTSLATMADSVHMKGSRHAVRVKRASVVLLGVVLASINIFGGFAVTGRMLRMFRREGEA